MLASSGRGEGGEDLLKMRGIDRLQPSAEVELLEFGEERAGDVGAVEREDDVGEEEADLAAAVEERPLYLTPVKACERISVCMASVSWISPPAPRGLLGEQREDLGLQDVAAGDDEVGRRVLGLGFSTMPVMRKPSSGPLPRATMP